LEDSAADNGDVVLRLGLSHATLDALGEVSNIEWAAPGRTMAGGRVATLRWSALRRGDSDELYHATWANVMGEHVVTSPLEGELLELNETLTPPRLDEGDAEGRGAWLARVCVPRDVWAAYDARRGVKKAADG
jgi:glycine cleavage system H lipoate-binding protein